MSLRNSVTHYSYRKLWIRGGYPRSFLARGNQESLDWRKNYISTFLERDIPNLGISIPAETLRRFWMMLSHCHGQTLNYSELGRSFGIADTTVRRYLDILSGTFMVRNLTPWFENISKRQVRSPKLYFRDTGILHWFYGTSTYEELSAHPKLGASWEGFALEEVIKHYEATPEEAYFWATQSNAELDLLLLKDGRRLGFEMKYTSSPKVTRSMQIALNDLKLDALTVIVPGSSSYPLTEKIRAVGLEGLTQQALS
ncbi:MAG: DUF4143 domain-containing protein [Bdellovibrionales bacterium]|nr:DUF4143 domain-containing protein [Bdellovibrionales bacterium]